MYTVRSAASLDIVLLCALDPVARIDHRRRELIPRAVAGGACFVVVAPGGQTAGYAVLEYSFYESGFISMLYVDCAHRRQGAATALLRYLECACKTPKLFTSTNLSNQPMQALLAKLSYHLSGVLHDLDPGDPELVYVKNVAPDRLT